MELQLLYFFIAVILGFTCLILFLLKMRKKLLTRTLLLTTNDVWETIKDRARGLRLERNDLIYGIYQDHGHFEAAVILRNAIDEDLGQSIYPLGKRKKFVQVGDESFIIEFPFTMNTTAILKKEEGGRVIASYAKTSWLGKHEFVIPGFGKLLSNQAPPNLKGSYTYSLNGNIVGMIQNISSLQNLGRVAILPQSIPVEVRLFMLLI